MTALSVVIPTRDRADRLTACLRTLAAQIPPPGGWEIVVLDDGSDPPLQGRVDEAGTDVRFVWQRPAGLNAARNRGIAETGGDVVAFLDDDTLVASGWAVALVRAFSEHACDGVGGRVRLRLEGTAPRWLTVPLRRYLAEFDLGDAPRKIDADPLPVGANCAITRRCVERVGGFAAGLDRDGTSLVSNGDTEFFHRLLAAGGTVRYVPEAAVEHCVPAVRLERSFLRRRAHAQGLSDGLLERRGGRSPTAMREYVRAGRAVPIAGKALVAGHGLARSQLWLDYCRGRLAARPGDSRPGDAGVDP